MFWRLRAGVKKLPLLGSADNVTVERYACGLIDDMFEERSMVLNRSGNGTT